jgi:c-di-GMP-binding flagellar brake protein YcgR
MAFAKPIWDQPKEKGEGVRTTGALEGERRGRIRVSAQLPITVKVGGEEAKGELKDISTRGMFFHFDRRLQVGSWIELVFRLPRKVLGVDGVWLRCSAEVVRVQEGMPQEKFGIGARISTYEAFRVN